MISKAPSTGENLMIRKDRLIFKSVLSDDAKITENRLEKGALRTYNYTRRAIYRCIRSNRVREREL